MHPATRAHIYGMIEGIRHNLKSIETAMAISANEESLPQHLAGAVKAAARSQAESVEDDVYTTKEEDDLIGKMFNLIDEPDSGGAI